MNKKIFLLLAALTMSLTSFAQFEKGKKYLSATVSGLNVHYSGADKWQFGIAARGGYMLADNWLAMGIFDYSFQQNGPKSLSVGAAARYYVIQNGLYLGAGVNYSHRCASGEKINDVVPNIHIGYAFFVSKTVTIEPELYYNQSLKSHSDYSDVGFRIGIGIYLDQLFPKL